MKKLTILAVAVIAAVAFTGCSTVRDAASGAKTAYQSSPLTPDGFNYTYATDKNLKSDGHWFGVSWSLK